MSTKQSDKLVTDFKDYGFGVEDSASVNADILKDIGKRIIDNFKTYRFCYLKNHGIDENLLNEYRRVNKYFFEQPESFKAQYPMGIECIFGYVKMTMT